MDKAVFLAIVVTLSLGKLLHIPPWPDPTDGGQGLGAGFIALCQALVSQTLEVLVDLIRKKYSNLHSVNCTCSWGLTLLLFITVF